MNEQDNTNSLMQKLLARRQAMEALKERAYEMLKAQGFEYTKRPKTPGYVDAVGLKDVEISTCPVSTGLRIDVSLPYRRKPIEGFWKVRCMRRDFLQNNQQIVVTQETLEQGVQAAYELARKGNGEA